MTEKFHHQLPDGHEVVLPRFENLPLGIIRKTRKLDRTDQVFTMLELLLPEADLEHFDALTAPEFEAFMTAWKNNSSIDLGKSSASPLP